MPCHTFEECKTEESEVGPATVRLPASGIEGLKNDPSDIGMVSFRTCLSDDTAVST